MSYAKKNRKNITASIGGVVALAALAVWQFYSFASFNGAQGGTAHLWWAIAIALLACVLAFVVFLVFVHHDTDDDLHITSPSRT
jgi:apolipoprotein N-acyltransferase